jgi:hypothetical protein
MRTGQNLLEYARITNTHFSTMLRLLFISLLSALFVLMTMPTALRSERSTPSPSHAEPGKLFLPVDEAVEKLKLAAAAG